MRYSIEAAIVRAYIQTLLSTLMQDDDELLQQCEEAVLRYTDDVPVLTTEVYTMSMDDLNAQFRSVSDWLATLGTKRIGLSLTRYQCAVTLKMLIMSITDLQVSMAEVLQNRGLVEAMNVTVDDNGDVSGS